MEGLLEEATRIMAADGKDQVRDAALIAAAQRVEHYELAEYGRARRSSQKLRCRRLLTPDAGSHAYGDA